MSLSLSSDLYQLNGWQRKSAARGVLQDCSLVIATYQRPREVVALLTTLTKLPDQPGEVIVVDGSVKEEVGAAIAAWLNSRSLGFDLVYVKSPPGLTRQRNVGIDASTKEFVFFLDDDCVPQAGYFEAIRQVFIEDSQKHIGAVCGSIVNEMDKPLSLRWRIRFFLRLVPRGESGKYYPTATSVPRSLVGPFKGCRQVDIVPGGAAAYRRSALLKQRFSQYFYGYSQGEDVEMSLRLGRAWKLMWCGDAHVIHQHAPSARPPSFKKGRMEVENRFFIWKRFSSDASPIDRIRFWLDIAYIFSYDLACFIARPRQVHNLGHAAGVARGAMKCFISPPRYEEPPASRQYEFCLEPFDSAT